MSRIAQSNMTKPDSSPDSTINRFFCLFPLQSCKMIFEQGGLYRKRLTVYLRGHYHLYMVSQYCALRSRLKNNLKNNLSYNDINTVTVSNHEIILIRA